MTHPDVSAIVTIINQLDVPLRPRKLSNDAALRDMVYVLKTGMPWRELRSCTGIPWQTVYKRFQKWMQMGLFQTVWRCMLEQYVARRLDHNPRWFCELFIDSTMIKNQYGVDCLGKNPTDRGRKASKQSILCDNAGIPVASKFFGANVADVQTVNETIAAVSCQIVRDGRLKTTIVGDKGYVSYPLAQSLAARKIRMLTPNKRGMRHPQKMTRERRDALRRRVVVEHVFCRQEAADAV